MLTGAIDLRDVAGLAEEFHYGAHRSLFVVFETCLETKRDRARGIPLRLASALVHRLAAPGPLGAAWPELWCLGGDAWADSRGRVVGWTGYVPGLARSAPRRREALDAVTELRGRAARAWDLEQDRAAVRRAVLEVAADAVAAYLRDVERDGGLLYVAGYEGEGQAAKRRYGLRPVERAALPTPAEAIAWIGGAA